MASLQITYEDLRRQISRFAGVGNQESDYSGDAVRLANVNEAMYNGLRSFYWPVNNSHRWSFLDTERTLALSADTYTYSMPADFARMTERFCYPAGSKKKPLSPIPMKHLRAMRSKDTTTGDPVYYALRPVEDVDGDRTLFEVAFYPTPNAAVTLTYGMELEPFVPTTSYSTKEPLGGAIHSETIIEACLAAAELVFNPESGPGYHAEQFQQLLAISIERDNEIIGEFPDSNAWPLDGITGGVTSLAVTKSQLLRLIGRALKYPPNADVWDHAQLSVSNEILRTALRKFYQPMIVPGQSDTHQWSFLAPIFTLDIIEGISTYDLPEDFSAMRGDITYAPATSIRYPRITLVSEEEVRSRLQSEGTVARPYVAALRVKHSDENTGTRYELLFAPIPSEDRQVEIPYSINPEQLGTDQSLPMGGQPHVQTIIEACLAATEIYLNSGNIHQREFLECLRTSVSFDDMLNSPQSFGYSGDRSDGYANGHWHDRHDSEQYTYYNGAVYWD